MRGFPRWAALYDEMKTECLQGAPQTSKSRELHPRIHAMKLPMVVKIAATLALIGLALWLGTSDHFYKSALLSLFFGVTLASVVLIHFRVRPSWLDAAGLAGGAIFFTVVDFCFLHFVPSLAGITSFLGISSLSILGLRAIWSQGAEQ
jgi:hypothetical protein